MKKYENVLILILLEDTLWVWEKIATSHNTQCLNPYSIGRYSVRTRFFRSHRKANSVLILILLEDTLWATNQEANIKLLQVLILILLEDTLWATNQEENIKLLQVLILILLEDTLWEFLYWTQVLFRRGVLILILLEDTLWELLNQLKEHTGRGLNPYSIGRYSVSAQVIACVLLRWDSLNPYSIGRYSVSLKYLHYEKVSEWS